LVDNFGNCKRRQRAQISSNYMQIESSLQHCVYCFDSFFWTIMLNTDIS
jgi:hypothetical protein